MKRGRQASGSTGAPSLESANDVVGELYSYQDTPLVKNKRGGSHVGQDAITYPSRPVGKDPYAEVLASKAEAVKALGGVPNIGITEKDIQFYRDAKTRLKYANFRDFTEKNTNFSNPYEFAKYCEIFPEYQEERKAIINKISDLQKRQAYLDLYGVPQSKEDWVFKYGVHNGDIDVPNVPVHMLPAWKGYKAKADWLKGLDVFKKWIGFSAQTKETWGGTLLDEVLPDMKNVFSSAVDTADIATPANKDLFNLK